MRNRQNLQNRKRLLKINEDILIENGLLYEDNTFRYNNTSLRIDRRRNDYFDGIQEMVDGLSSELSINNIVEFNQYFADYRRLPESRLIQVQDMLSDYKEPLEVVITRSNGDEINFPLIRNWEEGLKQLLIDGFFIKTEEEYGSDRLSEFKMEGIQSVVIREIPQGDRVRGNKSGQHFDYTNTTNLDLKKYQIYSSSEYPKQMEHCFIHSLKELGVSEDVVNSVKLSIIEGANLAKTHFTKIAELLKMKIILHQYRNDGVKKMKTIFGNKHTESVEICLYKDHYFIYELTEYNKYYINNYQKCVDEKYPTNIYRINYSKIETSDNEQYKIDSLSLVKSLFNQGFFIVGEYEHKNPKKSCIDSKLTDNIIEEQKEMIFNDKVDVKEYIFYADCESDVVSCKEHTPILIGVVSEEREQPEIFTYYKNTKVLVDDFLKYIQKSVNKKGLKKQTNGEKIIVYFHNLKYDYLGLLQKYCNTSQAVIKDNQYYAVSVNYFGLMFEFRDSYKLMNRRLADFPSIFGLDKKYSKKEAIGYTYYTKENIQQSLKRVSIDEYLPHIHKTEKYTLDKNPDEIRKEFISILEDNKEYFDYYGGKFNPVKYYKYYLKYDCLVLQKGIQKYVDIINNITSQNGKTPLHLHNYLTISSLTDSYMKVNGAYDEVFEMSGYLREFCSRAIQGGRVNVCKDFVKKVVDETLEDFDGVSLYPSAIDRCCRELGLPIGYGEVIKSFGVDRFDYYIVKILLKKINKKQQNSFIGIKNESGILEYVNEVKEGGEIIYVDKITLQDYIEFHEIEYDFIDGVYWDNGFNKKMGELINEFFNARLKYKKLKKEAKTEQESNGYDALQNVVKLMMNSSYGKTIIKTSNKKISYVNKNRIGEKTGDFGKNYVYSNFNTITKYREINENQLEIEQYNVDTSYNRCHIGCLILSYSKRIMNEVMNTANDNKLDIYYQDTDSLHIKQKDVPVLQEKYNIKYNRELVGKDLGQFHGDFDLKGSCGDIVSTRSIFLGKKCYIDNLQSKDKDGNTITGYHIRMKGVNSAGLEHRVNADYEGDYFKMFEDLSKGNKIKFVLNPTESAVSFEYGKCGGISTRTTGSFERIVSF